MVLARVLCGTLVLLLSPLLIHVAQVGHTRAGASGFCSCRLVGWLPTLADGGWHMAWRRNERCCHPVSAPLQGLDSLFVGHPTLMLYTVMIVCPLCMNVAQVRVCVGGGRE